MRVDALLATFTVLALGSLTACDAKSDAKKVDGAEKANAKSGEKGDKAKGEGEHACGAEQGCAAGACGGEGEGKADEAKDEKAKAKEDPDT